MTEALHTLGKRLLLVGLLTYYAFYIYMAYTRNSLLLLTPFISKIIDSGDHVAYFMAIFYHMSIQEGLSMFFLENDDVLKAVFGYTYYVALCMISFIIIVISFIIIVIIVRRLCLS